jgi:hypothetical protein
MTSATLFRLSGLALLVALPIQISGWLLHPPTEEIHHVLQSTYPFAHVLHWVSWFLLLLGLPGLYACQAHRAGRLGLASFVLLMLAAAYHLYLLLYEAFATPRLAEHPATQALVGPDGELAHGVRVVSQFGTLVVLAFPLFGIATLRAGVLPRWAGWLPIASLPVLMLGMIVLPASVQDTMPGWVTPIALLYHLLFAGYAWGGYALWTARAAEPAGRATRATPAVAAR